MHRSVAMSFAVAAGLALVTGAARAQGLTTFDGVYVETKIAAQGSRCDPVKNRVPGTITIKNGSIVVSSYSRLGQPETL